MMEHKNSATAAPVTTSSPIGSATIGSMAKLVRTTYSAAQVSTSCTAAQQTITSPVDLTRI
jgi:hypothetical protein